MRLVTSSSLFPQIKAGASPRRSLGRGLEPVLGASVPTLSAPVHRLHGRSGQQIQAMSASVVVEGERE